MRRSLPIGAIAPLEGWVQCVDGRKFYALARILSTRGEIYAEAKGLYITPKGPIGWSPCSDEA